MKAGAKGLFVDKFLALCYDKVTLLEGNGLLLFDRHESLDYEHSNKLWQNLGVFFAHMGIRMYIV